MQIIHHEIERGIARDDLVFPHQDQVRAATQFIETQLGPVEYGTHADCAHELGRVRHAVCLHNDMRYSDGWALILRGHDLGARRLSSAAAVSDLLERSA